MRCPCLKPAHSRLHLESPNLPSPPSRTNARPIQSMTRKQLNQCRAARRDNGNPAVAEGLPPLPAPTPPPLAGEARPGAVHPPNPPNPASTPPPPKPPPPAH